MTCVGFNFPVRYQITFLIFIGWVISMYLRANLSIAIVEMTKFKNITTNSTHIQQIEFDWSSKEQTFILSAYGYGYLLAPFGGIVATKYGGATVYGLGQLLTAFLTMLTPVLCRFNFYVFIFVRMLEGIFESTAAASSALVLSSWSPISERGRLTGIAFTGLFVGSAINYPVSGYLAHHFGWESVFYVSGAFTVVWYVVWISCVSNSPANHKRISEEEKRYIMYGNKNSIESDSEEVPIPWLKMLTSKVTISYLIIKFCVAVCQSFFVLCISLYINGRMQVNVYHVGLISGFINFSTALFQPAAAVLFDYVRGQGLMSINNIYKLYICAGFIGEGVLLLSVSYISENRFMIGVLFLCRFMAMWAECTSMILPVDISPRFSAVVGGFGTSTFSVGLILSPILLGHMVTDFTNSNMWTTYFIVLAAVNCAGSLIFLIFGSGQTQHWNEGSKKSSERTIPNNLDLTLSKKDKQSTSISQ